MDQARTTDIPVAAAKDSDSEILATWRRLKGWPAGAWIFSRMLGRMVRYSGTIGAKVREIEPGHALVEMRDTARVRNHLNSIHACAMFTLAELASGLALMARVPSTGRAIVTGIEIEYIKKGRGLLTAEGSAPPIDGASEQKVEALAVLRDQAGEEVARATAHWLVGPKKRRATG